MTDLLEPFPTYQADDLLWARAFCGLGLSVALASCATSQNRWEVVRTDGALTAWAACMESDGYNAWNSAGMLAAAALREGATPITRSQILRIGLAACEASGAEALAALTPAVRDRLYEDAEHKLLLKLAENSGQL